MTATVDIRDGSLIVHDGHVGTPDLAIKADGSVWLRFVAGDASLVPLLLRRKLRVRARLPLLAAFGRCFR